MCSSPHPPERRAVLLRLGWVLLLVLADLWSKGAAFAFLRGCDELVRCPCGIAEHDRWHLLGQSVGWLTFMEAENQGAAFGMGSSSPVLLVIGRLLAVGLLLVLLIRSPRGRWVLNAAFVLILAGALGNLYDNLARANWSEWLGDEGASFRFGAVRDFIDVYFARWKYHFPTFNVADSCITVGAVLLLSSGLFGGKEEGGAGASDPAAPVPPAES